MKNAFPNNALCSNTNDGDTALTFPASSLVTQFQLQHTSQVPEERRFLLVSLFKLIWFIFGFCFFPLGGGLGREGGMCGWEDVSQPNSIWGLGERTLKISETSRINYSLSYGTTIDWLLALFQVLCLVLCREKIEATSPTLQESGMNQL